LRNVSTKKYVRTFFSSSRSSVRECFKYILLCTQTALIH
jgi:hypothetical protein